MKCHAMTFEFTTLCGKGTVTTIINGRKNDRLAKLVTCKTCKRLWKKIVRS